MNIFSYLTRASMLLAVSLLVVGTVLGCGGDDDEYGGDKKSDSGVTGTGGTKKTGGTGGRTGTTTGTAGTAAASCTTTTSCDGQDCDATAASSAVSSQFGSLLSMLGANVCFNACCTNSGKCGAQLMGTGMAAMILTGGSCVEVKQDGKPDTACPSSTQTGDDAGTAAPGGIADMLTGFFNYQGCCRPDARCGLELTALGLGCVANEDIPQISSLFAGFVTAKSCTP